MVVDVANAVAADASGVVVAVNVAVADVAAAGFGFNQMKTGNWRQGP